MMMQDLIRKAGMSNWLTQLEATGMFKINSDMVAFLKDGVRKTV
jgi:hypothetical protein